MQFSAAGALPAELAARFAQGRIPHAVLLEAPAGEARERAVRELTAAIVCTGSPRPCRACVHCRKVFAGIHPDVSVLEDDPKQRVIRVDDIRRIRSDAYIRANEAEGRVFILQEAQRMNEEAQNALLKLLEEPPAGVHLLLTAPSRAAFLPTVRSRLAMLRLSGVQAVRAPDERVDALLTALASGERYALLRTSAALLADRAEGLRLLRDAKAALRDAAADKLGLENRRGAAGEEAMRALSARVTRAQVLRLTALVDETARRLGANANQHLLSAWFALEAQEILSRQ